MRKLILFLVTVTGVFCVMGLVMILLYWLHYTEYKHIRPLIVIGKVEILERFYEYLKFWENIASVRYFWIHFK